MKKLSLYSLRMGGRLADRFSPVITTCFLLLAMILSLLIVSAIIMTFVTGSITFAVIAPMQMLMVNTAKGAEMQASANIGNALGSLPSAAGYSYISPEYVGAAPAFTGLVLCVILYVRLNKPAPLAFQTVK